MKKINDLDIEEYSICQGELEYLLIKDTEENKIILNLAGMSQEELLECSCDGFIDIAGFIQTNWHWNQDNGLVIKENKNIIHFVWRMKL